MSRFVSNLAPDDDHPFFGMIPGSWTLNLWATILTGCGHHQAHLHDPYWLSGTYYVQVPASCRPADSTRAGWIEFDGFTRLPGLAEHTALVRRVAPIEGLLVMFPSYVMHQTVQFDGDDTRTGLSFDIAPRGG